ncbi:hypothetical protein B0I00_0798 [Novosphingobium kunmingense]|uniref:Preprotein translocase subunit YajC n=1 Tax=Novosphingobium kunmingense TaxID=1211806 RepID=A0A2N0I324_9SPHN|nr:preprotein translocase subunit YajC [Novosphingobium kunmingense]PKB25596.1 hypothetical protein B0I00_0798 [Novosphingobium kunmingense]
MKPALALYRLLTAALLALGVPCALHAQGLPDDASDSDEASIVETPVTGGGGAKRAPHVTVAPYIEASQVLLTQLSPGSDTLTYTSLAAGLDAVASTRRAQGALSLRYERRIGWEAGSVDSDTLSGIARAQVSVVPRLLTIEAGAMAARTGFDSNGSTASGVELGNSTNIYSVFAGPSIATQRGDVAIEGHYRYGYTKVSTPDARIALGGTDPVDLFDSSSNHNAKFHVGTRAGQTLPVGLGAGIGFNREDVSNLDQRIEDFHARGDLAVPVSDDLQLLGGLGWEKVEVSSRDALRDQATGLPVIGSDGRYVTDRSVPRQIAFESEGLIWDAGVMWRPSRRTAVEAHVGWRYGSRTYYGSAAYAPNARTAVNVSVYDSLSGLGAAINRALVALPTEFEAVRNPLTGELLGCVTPQGPLKSSDATCLNGAFYSLRSSVFRGRGVTASVNFRTGRLGYGLGAGYDRRRFIAVPGTIIGATNLTIDETWWVAAYLKGRIDQQSSFGASLWANWFESGSALTGNSSALGANGSYNRLITDRLVATAALGITGVNRDDAVDAWTAQALAGLRYEF